MSERSSSVQRAEALERVARGWDAAAEGYDGYFVPRFAPWVALAVDGVGEVPGGPILVPCCGTFPELKLLLERFPGREIAGIDLSAGMVRIARERAARSPMVEVIQGDASTLDPRWTAGCAGVVSVFGLQQLPEPEDAVQSWFGALRPGGRLSVVYWPAVTEEDGPFALLSRLLPGRSVPDWEAGLVPRLSALGATIERDEQAAFPMSHADAAGFFDAFAQSGPLRAAAIARGDEFIADLRMRFLQQAPGGEWTHHPRARLIVARR
ncbi:hypothetical protein GCM10029976_025780 [Kribbella albertanoniae]|uniref:Class I SAM-dependent methyltransferase n=1 Tax=Kribbella albertanoniae TaxID=1266829 RepID=A0A4R4P652_9ACTN|nr:class I SAM-dependent methyltransferase [Kribbella albertanoniae]TDC16303.1 class I SAM-dependent methyltransferase [Kribbella albertanoniae]